MKYVSFSIDNYHSIGALVDDVVMDVGVIAASKPGPRWSPLRRLLADRGGDLRLSDDDLLGLPGFARRTVTIEPVVPDPFRIITARVRARDRHTGRMLGNYIDELTVSPQVPATQTGSGTTVRLTHGDRRFDDGGRLAVIIGRTATNVSIDAALSYVAGYCEFFANLASVGPVLVTPDEVGDLPAVRLPTHATGTHHQDADLPDFVWGIPQLVSYTSSVMTLHPADIITVSSSSGTPHMRGIDNVSVELSKIGTLELDVDNLGKVVSPITQESGGPASSA